ncbi:MAG: hypothetical protein EAY75_11435 [Bacteroidetes bacterium]|nr:MAG: hypothetical protein EAY75_11435 [Bacteroidota bacterium]
MFKSARYLITVGILGNLYFLYELITLPNVSRNGYVGLVIGSMALFASTFLKDSPFNKNKTRE